MSTLHLFEAYGIELEYMIVDRTKLDVAPIADRILVENDHVVMSLERGPVTWSNELAKHVIELKCSLPTPDLVPYREHFRRALDDVRQALGPHAATLLPGGAHPWMMPDREFQRWDHGDREIYATFDRIFDCRGHGWSNLQSMHLNLPFCGDEELGRLHAAIRLILPILPAMTASSPFLEGKRTGFMDTRMEVYRHNARKLPIVSGRVIPEPAFSERAYRTDILEPMYRAIAPFDPDGILQDEWLNARGAIVRFDRNAIEIRVMDTQEHPGMDLAVAHGVTEVLRALVSERWSSYGSQCMWPVEPLANILDGVIRDAEESMVSDAAYLSTLGLSAPAARAQDLWRHLLAGSGALSGPFAQELHWILDKGSLATRLVGAEKRKGLKEVYRSLADCLASGSAFSEHA